MEIGAEEFGDCRGVRIQQAMLRYRSNPPTYISSSGEMKMSLKLMTCGCSADRRISALSAAAYVLMLEVLQQLQLSVCSLRQDRRAEGFHDLLHRNRLSGELVLRRAVRTLSEPTLPIIAAVPLTRRARRLPCRPAAGQCIYRAISMFVSSSELGVGVGLAPACDFEGGAEDLSAHELRHLCCDLTRRSISLRSEDADVGRWERLRW